MTDWREERDKKNRAKPLYKKCQQELIKMFDRLIKKESPFIAEYKVIDGLLYFKSFYLKILIMCPTELEQRINAKVKKITGNRRVHMWIDEKQKMTALDITLYD